MDQAIKAKWVAELRNPNNRQAQGELRAADGAYCCLGILCNLIAPEKWKFGSFSNPNKSENSAWKHISNSGMPDGVMLEGIELSYSAASSLAEMNDTGKSFSEIADYIEENL